MGQLIIIIILLGAFFPGLLYGIFYGGCISLGFLIIYLVIDGILGTDE